MLVDTSLKMFGSLCRQVTAEPSLTVKAEILGGYLHRYPKDLGVLLRLLLPKYAERIYHVQERQLLRVIALVLAVPEETLRTSWNGTGCVAETAQKYFTPTVAIDADGWCDMDVDTFDNHLDLMAAATNEAQRVQVVTNFLKVACQGAVYLFFRELKHDLRLGAGLRVVLSALHPSAYAIFQHCASIPEVVRRLTVDGKVPSLGSTAAPAARAASPVRKATAKGPAAAAIALGIPLAPMLAAPARSVDQLLAKCPNGAFSEVKYDGERIQIHSADGGATLHCFARLLKPMRPDKYSDLLPFLREAITPGECILDGEILMVDLKTSLPLPFGTLGEHKKTQFTSACTCVFLFDILYKDGESLLSHPLEERRALLKSSVKFIRNRVMYSELCLVTGDVAQRTAILQRHLSRAIAEGLEGLVVKDIRSTYEPRARHWLKIKKDYLSGLADSADLLVLGAWYGSGNKGGLLSVFLMGCVDADVPPGSPHRFKTVCKVGNGLDDMAITVLSKKYASFMTPVKQGASAAAWLACHTSHLPDMIMIDPTRADVMEIIGAEFSITNTHTCGVSIRFPRILRMRTDKNVDTATTNQELLTLYTTSKGHMAAAGLPDHSPLPLIDSCVIVDEDEDSAMSAPAPAPLSAASLDNPGEHHPHTPPVAGTPRLVQVEGDATLLAAPLTENVVLCHSTAAGGRWSGRGFMGRLTEAFGPAPAQAYNHGSAEHQLGSVIFTEVGGVARAGRVFAAFMIAQAAGPRGEVPQVDAAAFAKCLTQCVDFAVRSSASLHVVKPPASSGCTQWAAVVSQLTALSAEKGVLIVCYDDRLAMRATLPPAVVTAVARGGPTSTATATTAAAPAAPDKIDEGEPLAKRPRIEGTAVIATAAVASVPSPPPNWCTLLRRAKVCVIGPDTDEAQVVLAILRSLGATVAALHAGYPTPLRPSVSSSPLFTHVVLMLTTKAASRMEQTASDELDRGGPSTDSLSEVTATVGAAANVAVSSVVTAASADGAAVVHSQWVLDCFRDGVLHAEGLYHPARLTVLTGSRLFFTPLFLSQRVADAKVEGVDGGDDVGGETVMGNEWLRIATLLGATIHESWKLVGQRTSYCIAETWADPDAESVFELGGRVVHPRWLVDCAVAGKAVPVRSYLFHRGPAQRRKSTGGAPAVDLNPLEGILCGLSVYVPPPPPASSPGSPALLLLHRRVCGAVVQMGGRLAESSTEAQYCVLLSRQQFHQLTNEGGEASPQFDAATRFRCVSTDWIWDSAHAKSLQDPSEYMLCRSTAHAASGGTGARLEEREETASEASTETWSRDGDVTEPEEVAQE